jgi:hypothetical protein
MPKANVMPISIDWDNPEKTVVRVTLGDDWSWENLGIIHPVIVTLLGSVENTVHILVDYTQTNVMADGGPSHAFDFLELLPPNGGQVAVVTPNLAIRRVLNAVGILSDMPNSTKIQGVATFEDAYRLFAEYDNREQ